MEAVSQTSERESSSSLQEVGTGSVKGAGFLGVMSPWVKFWQVFLNKVFLDLLSPF